MEYTEVPKGAATKQTKLYSLKEISSMIAAIEDDPVASAVIGDGGIHGSSSVGTARAALV